MTQGRVDLMLTPVLQPNIELLRAGQTDFITYEIFSLKRYRHLRLLPLSDFRDFDV